MDNKEILSLINNELDCFIKKYNLKLIDKKCDRTLLVLCLSDGKDYIYINRAIHPYDFPFELIICFGKHEPVKDKDIKWISCKPKLPLWVLDESYNPTMGTDEEQIITIKNGCKGIQNYYPAFKEMSTVEVLKEYQNLMLKAKEANKNRR